MDSRRFDLRDSKVIRFALRRSLNVSGHLKRHRQQLEQEQERDARLSSPSRTFLKQGIGEVRRKQRFF